MGLLSVLVAAVSTSAGAGRTVVSGPLSVTINHDLSLAVSIGGHGTAVARPPNPFVFGSQR